jgi:hypothetical protein
MLLTVVKMETLFIAGSGNDMLILVRGDCSNCRKKAIASLLPLEAIIQSVVAKVQTNSGLFQEKFPMQQNKLLIQLKA